MTPPSDPTDAVTDAPAGRRRDVLDLLRRSAAPLSIADIARRLEVHPNTARFHLDTLVGHGQAEQVTAARTGPGRPPLLFRASPGMDRTGPRNYRLLASILVEELSHRPRPTQAAVAAGRAWGGELAEAPDAAAPSGTVTEVRTTVTEARAVEGLIRLLDDLGFAPERPPRGGVDRIGLRHCPFLDLAQERSKVVCPIHLGLIQGALAAMEAPLTAERLEPFVEPDLCVVHLGRAARPVEGKGR
ncbi:helix-turn-helix domain-containing protein [Streptomyces sp. NPDC008317]|uniref:helix-turn-helix transcriptional regulator n=1 Tax=Streptomyces sp. NPDC008317 TaxID=3364827 RepID=UPI0036E09EA5